jgi:iron complex outermembrane receptor protein
MGTTAVYANDKSLHRPSGDGNNRIHMLTAAWELGDLGPLGSVTLKSISGYRNMTVNNNNALSGSPLHVLDFLDQGNLETWSQELQMIGTAPRLHYVLGGYYYGEHTTDNDEQTVFSGLSENRSRNTGTVEAFAPFGQVTVTPPILNDKLSITAGLRFSYEHVSVKRDYRSGSFAAGLKPVTGFPATAAGSFGVHGTALPGLSPMANIAYQWTDNTMTYLKVSRGFQSGTVNGRAATAVDFKTLIEPENLMAYEGGMKSQWFDNRLRLNVDGFLSEYTNQLVQIIIGLPNGGGFTTLDNNVGTSEFWGFELEAVALPLRGVEASLNYAYLNTRYLKWVSNGVNVANHRDVAEAPDHTIVAGLTYTAPPTSAGVFLAHVDAYWVDSTINNVNRPLVNGVEHAQISVNGNYALFNARLQFVDIPLQKGSLDISAYCHNLVDRQYRTFGIDLRDQIGYMTSNFGDPRTFGLQLTYNFSES